MPHPEQQRARFASLEGRTIVTVEGPDEEGQIVLALDDGRRLLIHGDTDIGSRQVWIFEQ